MRPFDPLDAPLNMQSLIEASAGTGKTYTIANLYLRLLAERNLKVEEILVVTFTKAATEELRGRIRRRIVETARVLTGIGQEDPFLNAFVSRIGDGEAFAKLLNNALRSFDLASIFTIHGFCLRMLHNHAFESGSLFDTALMEDQTEILRQITDDFWRKNFYPMTVETFTGLASAVTRDSLLDLAKKCMTTPFLVVDSAERDVSVPVKGSSSRSRGKGKKPPDPSSAPAVVDLRRRFIDYVKLEYGRRKTEANVRSYGDLLSDLHQALKGAGGKELAASIKDRYKAALVDEFQDTDPLQYEIFKMIYGGTDATLFLIGDPKQSIYGFRGADIFSYMKAVDDVGERYTLPKNWRSSGPLLRAVNAVFAASPAPFVFESLPFSPVDEGARDDKGDLILDGERDPAPFTVWFLERGRDEKVINKGEARARISSAVRDEVVSLITMGLAGRAMIDDRPLDPGDIAVLVPTNWEARSMQKVLAEARVPAVVYGTESIFRSHEAMEVERLMTGILDPSDETKVKTALTTDLLGLSGDDLARFTDDEEAWDRWIEKFEEYRSQWTTQGFITMARNLIAGERVRSRLRAFPDGERRLTNLLHCSELLHRASVAEKLGMEGLVKWLTEKREQEGESQTEEHQIRLETDEKAVKIVTIHKSKGLEYPVVFCPFSWGGSEGDKDGPGVYHDRDREFEPTIDIGFEVQDRGRRAFERERLAENIRLLYVALTRAKYRCYVAWGYIKGSETSALAYLLHGPKDIDKEAVSLESLRSRMQKFDDCSMRTDLGSLAERSEGAVRIAPLPGPAGLVYSPAVSQTGPLRCRRFTGSIEDDWHTSSFSALVSGRYQAAELPDRDREYRTTDVPEGGDGAKSRAEAPTIFDFPRGTVAGTCLHNIFEHVDFSMGNEGEVRSIIGERLEAYGFESAWLDVVYEAVRNVLTVSLMGKDKPFTLSSVGTKDRRHEVEFYTPLDRITPRDLGAIFQSRNGVGPREGFGDLVGNLEFKPVQGMLRGFIDMVFDVEGRYYLVDWKSNYLGPGIEDYREDRLQAVMKREVYILQYHLYAVALHKFLGAKIRDYGYERHFGGIYYLFLRGIDAEKGGDYGIFFDRPAYDLIEQLTSYLTGT